MKDFDSTTHTLRAETSSAEPPSAAEGAAVGSTAAGATLEGARAQLESSRGPSYWRSLEELAETPSFSDMLQREFPRQAAEWGNLDRRRFLQLSGASLGLAGLTACTKQPPEKVIPFVRQPEDIVPGRPLYFATAVSHRGFAAPVLAESHMGRPTKLEGNPEHPASQGATDAITQASILGLYDPDRSQSVMHLGRIRAWEALLNQIDGARSALESLEGEGLAVVTGHTTSPTLIRLLDELSEAMPKARRFVTEPAASRAAEGAAMATGSAAQVTYDFEKADVVLAIDSSFLDEGPGSVRYSKDFGRRRKAHTVDDASAMSRLYVVDSAPTATSTVADHRLVLKPSALGSFLVALASELGVGGASAPAGLDERATAWVEEVAADLRAHSGACAVVVGDYADPELHALGLAINGALGNLGSTVRVAEAATAEGEDLDALLAAIDGEEVSTLVLLDVNPVYGSNADQDVAARLQTVPLRIHLGAYLDETAELCHWHIPQSHCLESWGDLRSPDGTATVVQPLIERLYDSRTAIDIVAAFVYGSAGLQATDEYVRETWRQQPAGSTAADFDKAWRKWLHDGHIPGTEAVATVASANAGSAAAAISGAASSASGLELLFRPDPTVFDGRYANNGWLQECPKPITKLTWDNALLMSPRTAEAKGLGELLIDGEQRDRRPMVNLTVGAQSLELPVWVVPGMADDTLLLHLGYGRRKAGNVGSGVGFDANVLRSAETGEWSVHNGVDFSSSGNTYLLACTQDHHSMEGRDLVRSTNVQTYEEYPDNPLGIHHHFDIDKSLMPGDDYPYNGHRWGMSIDLTSCTGCNSCLVACVSENNIPVVGKDQVRRGREMHWIRLDRYFVGDDPNEVETVVNQPVPCMQCEQAPCEVVCPVAATVHSDEGLNDMVYNRCVGTRYCSNNCPYKVRRFNFLLYQDFETPQLKLGRNPDVTVRSRGVMEKCTYCVQRINHARIDARTKFEEIPSDSIQTACQQACPSDAIVFGDLADETSALSALKASHLDYGLLEEIGTRPRTTYLGRVTNPNPRLWARLYPDRPLVEVREHHGDDHGDGHGGDASHGDDHAAGTDSDAAEAAH